MCNVYSGLNRVCALRLLMQVISSTDLWVDAVIVPHPPGPLSVEESREFPRDSPALGIDDFFKLEWIGMIGGVCLYSVSVL